MKIIILVALAAVAGCASTVDVHMAPGASTPREVAVLDFEAHEAFKAAREYTLWSIVGSGRPGALVARAMRREMEQSDRFDVVTIRDMRTKLSGVSVDRDAGDEAWVEMGEVLEARAVVVGEIVEYRTISILFVQWTNVEFRARCLSVGSGNQLWSATAKGRAFYTVEEDLSARLNRELVKKLR